MLQILLALDCRPDVFVAFSPYQAFQPISPRKAICHPFAMFLGAAPKIAGYADVERAIRPVGYDVDPAAQH